MRVSRRWVRDIDGWWIEREGGGRYVVVTPSGHDLAWLDTEQQAVEYVERRLAGRAD
jgi:hypothetical protein